MAQEFINDCPAITLYSIGDDGRMSKYPNFNTPYEAGYDAGENGASVKNSHFGFFSTPERTNEWQRGKKDAEAVEQPTAQPGEEKP